jgi:uncharacterized SAM-dependent methyltransferase
MNAELQIIHEGLMAPNAWLSPKFFYDETGSKLFEAITRLPEYYLTRTEKTIFEQARSALVDLIGTGPVMIDLGAGNCEKAEQLFKDLRPSHAELLREVARLAGPTGRCLIGIDLLKPTEILEAAYNDAQGITAEFNLNMLRVVNAVAKADFDLSQWKHRAFFNVAKKRIEMHLESTSDQWVHWCGGKRLFQRGERIHTENSYKFTLAEFESLLQKAGLSQRSVFTDEHRWFALVIAEPA